LSHEIPYNDMIKVSIKYHEAWFKYKNVWF